MEIPIQIISCCEVSTFMLLSACQCCTIAASVPVPVLNGGGSSLGINVNQTHAMALPAACKVKTPPASQCNASSPSGTPKTPNSPSGGGGSKTVPTTEDGTSAGNSVKLSFSLFFFLLFMASWSA